jgi:hypothetical protein
MVTRPKEERDKTEMTTEEQVIAEAHRKGMAMCFDSFFLQQLGIEDWDAEGALNETE